MNVKVKKILKPVLIVGVIAGIGVFAFRSVSNKAAEAMAAMDAPRTMTLQKGDLSDVVSVNGTVFSEKSTNIYSNVNASVKAVHVEVGDRVEEGDLLAELDSSDLEHNLKSTQATLQSGQASAQHALEMAKKNLTTYEKNLNDDTNTSLIQAESALKSAELGVDSALTATGRLRKEMSRLRDDGYDKDDEEYKKVKEAHEDAQAALEKANASLEAAQKSYEAAKENNKTGTASEQERLRDQIKSAELGTNFSAQSLSIQKIQEDIAACRITAPVSGTVTAVNAVEGGSSASILFVIQDGEKLRIVTNIKEYDVATVALGDPVTIKSDSLPDREFEGVLAKIAPASNAAAGGQTQVSPDAEYRSEISVTGENQGLLIGMNTRLSIITEERRDVFSVPYEAVGQNEAGDLVVYAVETGEDDKVIPREIVVAVGLETDLFSEISADGLTEGMELFRDAAQAQAKAAQAAPPADGAKIPARRAFH